MAKFAPNMAQDNVPRTSDGWDKVAACYNENSSRFTSLHAADLVHATRALLLDAKIVLDIGCGTGALAQEYISTFPNGIAGQTFICSDLSPKMLEIAKQRVHSKISADFRTTFKFQEENGTKLEGIQDHSIDVVMSAFGVFLIPHPDEVFIQIKRVLRPGGAFANAAWSKLPDELETHLKIVRCA